LIYLRASGVPHIVGKLSMRVTTLLQTSPQLKVFTKSYGLPKLRDTQFSGQNDIWVQAPWPSIKNIIRGKVMASPKSGLWWVLWVRACPWLVDAPKCFNHALTNLLFNLCRFMWIIDSFVTHCSPHPKAPAHPSTLKCYELKAYPNSFWCFHFWIHIWVFQGVWGCVTNDMITYNILWNNNQN